MSVTPLDVTPEAHRPDVIPAAVDQTRDDDRIGIVYSPREARSWRLTEYAQAGGPATEQDAGGPYSGEHSSHGAPDPRHVWGGRAGQVGAPRESIEPEWLGTYRERLAIGSAHAPDRARAGSTGADPTRPAWWPRWLFSRYFDQWAEYEPHGVGKIEQGAPRASLPLAYVDDIADGLPSAGGALASGMESDYEYGNTVRLTPAPRDVRPESVTISREQATRARGWGLR